MRKHYTFESVDLANTGSFVYVFIGKLSSGEYFIADSSQFDVRIMDACPEWEKEETWFEDWQVSHLIQDLNSETESPAFMIDMLEWLLTNETDYCKSDIKKILDVAKEEQAALDR